MAKKKALVGNAASESQVKNAEKKELQRQNEDTEDINAVMKTVEGRRLLWRVLEECKVFNTICHPSGSMTYYNSGRQDLGHWLMSQVANSGENNLFILMKENYKGEINVC